MNNFKKKDDDSFFIVVDMPLWKDQCQKLYALLDAKLPDTVWDVTTDNYGSFIVELHNGVEQSDELYEKIWDAGEQVFLALHTLGGDMWDGLDVIEDLDYYVDSFVAAHRTVGYTIDNEQIANNFNEWYDVDKTKVEKILFLDKLAMEAA
tara:strand:- start:1766 stop:2215 length:450 start_codon:yes stop_codon:yes gene_type:complete